MHRHAARYDARQIYTYTGELELLVLNPYENLDGACTPLSPSQHTYTPVGPQ